MAEWPKWLREWVPIPLIRNFVRHFIGIGAALILFTVLIFLIEKIVPFEWLKGALDAVDIFAVLYLAGLLAVELLVSTTREICKNLKENHNEA